MPVLQMDEVLELWYVVLKFYHIMEGKSARYRYSSISEVGQLIRENKLSPVQLVKDSLARIKELNPGLNSFITIMESESEDASRLAEDEIKKGNWRGPLHGMPVAVKDFYDTKGVRTTAAFEYFKDRIPLEDSVVVKKLKDAGAIILGKTNMDKLGMGTISLTGYFGPVHNPWNMEYIAGGSSGGSAASIAAGLCYATIDTDAIGSCRLPAACCGVTGFKVSPGLISQKGILEGEKADDVILHLAQTGITTRYVEDAAIMLNVLSEVNTGSSSLKNDYFLAFTNKEMARIGIVKNFEASAAVRYSFSKAVEHIKSLGYHTNEVDVPFKSASFDIKNMEADRAKINKTLFENVNVLILPTTTDQTLKISDAEKAGPQALAPDNTMFCNYFGLPAVSIVCGFDSIGLPLGLQIVSHAEGEVHVLEVAHAFEKTSSWHLKHPRL